MIDTLRLARRWREAQNDPERMVEALADELGVESVSKADLRALETRIDARFETFKAEIRSEMASFRNQVLGGQLAMFVALVALILYRT